MMNRETVPICKTVCFNTEKIERLKAQLPNRRTLESRARRHKALGHAARQAIVHILAYDECCVCDLASILDMPVSTVSQHLRLLASSGLLQSRQQGKLVFYSLAGEPEPVS